MKRETRASKYQFKFKEIRVDYSSQDAHAETNMSPATMVLYYAMQDNADRAYSQRQLELRDRLLLAIKRLTLMLTDRHRQIVNLIYLSGEPMTQEEVAEELDVSQATIVKALNGNPVNERRYGGIFKKFKKLIENDIEIQYLLYKINNEE